MGKAYVYTLLCPYSQEVRYVGQTIDPYTRYHSHINGPAVSKALSDWLESLDTTPIFEIIDECSTEEIDEKEKKWIAYFHKNGIKLLNQRHVPNSDDSAAKKAKSKISLTYIRFSDEELAELDRLAVHLHKDGVYGVTNRDGTAVKREVLRYLLNKKLEYFEQQESQQKSE